MQRHAGRRSDARRSGSAAGPDAQLDGSGFFEAVFELEPVVAFELVGAFELVADAGHGVIGNDCTSTADPR